jgi:hypothetical protein
VIGHHGQEYESLVLVDDAPCKGGRPAILARQPNFKSRPGTVFVDGEIANATPKIHV